MSPEPADWWERARRELTTARELVRLNPDAAASRAYYAAFYAIRAFFSIEGRSFRKHSAVEAAVHRELVRDREWPAEIRAFFSFLMKLRETGDYGGEAHVSAEQAIEAIEKAGAVVRAVASRAPEPFLPIEDE